MTNQNPSIRAAYDEWAEFYDRDENPTRDLNFKAIREESLDLSGKKVLEIGCGTGLNTEYLAHNAANVVAVDFSEKMLQKARQRLETGKVDFIKADITKPWDFECTSFDLVIANLVLEHVEQLSHVFEETYRVLNPNGEFYIAELHPYKQLQNSQAKFTSKMSGEEVLVDAFDHSISEFINTGIKAGFNLLGIEEWKSKGEDIPRLLTLHFQKSGV